MPDDLYRTDIVTWSRQQAERLRRHVAGERVNDLDWEHVIEEIEDLGLSEINAVASLLTQAMVHALKIARWPDSEAVPHWTAEAVNFLAQAQRRYRPSMATRIAAEECFDDARRVVLATPGQGPEAPIPAAAALDLPAVMDRGADLRALIETLGHGPA
ncbi:DUF29 domain-containing protein [Siccirubricoccus sp. KC 17139]|uniref:DUF29 domain-containing protein n=1 Tax=Siccirubricoccus soli TaxID=2899147 RepID=A0ABT1D1K2_9PROT|nr:DUF29 domain-containing protein [Siccirubricoccus soli]MCO6415767.1 DUF29 domain-containing protein [Siccirubricoccus soli]MCP2681899.1 DUF29 domain-containing protein [Siccirubricoccus soli]